MAGQIQGRGFKGLLNQLVADPIVGAEMRQRVQQMTDEGWYDWEEYVALLQRLEERLSTRGLLALAYNAAATEKDRLRAMGLNSPETIFANYPALVTRFARGLAPGMEPQVVEFDATHVIIDLGDDVPRGLSEGYLRGWAVVAGVELSKVVVTPIERDNRRFFRFELRWSQAGSTKVNSPKSQLR